MRGMSQVEFRSNGDHRNIYNIYSSEVECFVLHEIVEQRSERLGELSDEPRIEQYY